MVYIKSEGGACRRAATSCPSCSRRRGAGHWIVGLLAIALAAFAEGAGEARRCGFLPSWSAQPGRTRASSHGVIRQPVGPLRVSYMTTPPKVVPFNHTGRPVHSSAGIAIEDALPPSQAVRPPAPKARPADLPLLSPQDLILLRTGQRVQHQIRNGCMGTGYVVVDVKADASEVWRSLLNFERYPEMIPTIRKVRVASRYKALTRGTFTLSKFRFKLSVVHRHKPEESRLDFYLDPDADQYGNILEMAEGFWYVDERPTDRPEGWTRVYMMATVKVNSLVPLWLVEYAAERALKRATAWLKPWVEMMVAVSKEQR